MSSKTAAVKILEYLAAENPHLYVVNVQPGIIDTHLLQKSGLDTEKLPMDTGELSSNPLHPKSSRGKYDMHETF